MTAVAISLALVVGIVLGLLGGGGSILTVPVLVYIVGIPAKSAIATSLLVVGTTSAIALIPHARRGHVQWKIGLWFGAFGMLGAFAGGRAAAWLPGKVLLLAFAAIMVAAGLAMLRPRTASTGHPTKKGADLALQATLVGLFTGLVGAGGGFVVVPALSLWAGLSMRAAVATSLLVIAVQSAAGLAGHYGHVALDVDIALPFAAAASLGALLGSRLSQRVSAASLRRGFGVFILVIAAAITVRELLG